jgi:hypothetical protein
MLRLGKRSSTAPQQEPTSSADGAMTAGGWGSHGNAVAYIREFLGLNLVEQSPETGLFSTEWTRKHCSASEPGAHASHATVADCVDGLGPRLSPVPFFDAHYYLKMNTDVRVAGLNAFFHWTSYGIFEGRHFCSGVAPRVLGTSSDSLQLRSGLLRQLGTQRLALISVATRAHIATDSRLEGK